MSFIQLLSLSILLGLALLVTGLIPFLTWRSKRPDERSFLDFLFKG
jgi:hypothetical protein